MSDYYDLGSYSRRITTTSPEAQKWFDRGLAWTYGFNHDEAISCYRTALEHDPACAMAHWGIAYAAGPNYNKQWKHFDPSDLAATLETRLQRHRKGAGTLRPGRVPWNRPSSNRSQNAIPRATPAW